MQILVYDAHSYDHVFLDAANGGRYRLTYTSAALDVQTAALADGFPAICCFVNDHGTADVLQRLAAGGTRLIALRCTGFNNIDLVEA